MTAVPLIPRNALGWFDPPIPDLHAAHAARTAHLCTDGEDETLPGAVWRISQVHLRVSLLCGDLLGLTWPDEPARCWRWLVTRYNDKLIAEGECADVRTAVTILRARVRALRAVGEARP